MDPRTSVMAFYVGGPLDATSEPVSLIDGRPPWERRCADTPPQIGPSDIGDADPYEAPRVGVYLWKGGTQAQDFEGFPGDKRWVQTRYEWAGWR